MTTIEVVGDEDNAQGWFCHPVYDVAVIHLSWEILEKHDIQWDRFSAGNATLTRTDVRDRGFHEGDEVFLLGFPIGWSPGSQDYPIVRSGVLAQIRGWLKGDHKTFLVDGSGFPGNSGGPIVTKPQIFSFGGSTGRTNMCLIGMVMERRYSELETENYPSYEQEYWKETADLIEVVPMEQIDETINLAMSMFEADEEE